MINRFLIFCFSLTIFVQADEVDFQRDVRPILSENCFQCHGPDANTREADLRLDRKLGLYEERDGGRIIDQEKPSEGLLLQRLTTDDDDLRMPPIDSGKELKPDQIELIRKWISEGADWQEHWSFSTPEKVEPPKTKFDDWGRNEIDSFVANKLQANGLSPEADADRRTLIRRLYLDLIGLPPSSKDVHSFLRDSSSNAYEKVVDSLLQSDHFGERMALSWLDQARYADTNGYSIDGGREMWLWRDWLIHAFNQNMPFDQFIVEQLAGDLLPQATTDQLVATGFNRNHMITHEGGTIPAENLVNYVSDRVRTTGEVFLGLTIGCAQCHDHKYDPISQKDYYRFFAYFNSIEDRGLDGNSGVNAVPKIKATSVLARHSNEVESLRNELVTLQSTFRDYLQTDDFTRYLSRWESEARLELESLGKDMKLHPVEVLKVTSPNRGSAYQVLDDGTVYIPNGHGRSPSVSAKIDVDGITGLRIVFSPDEKFPGKGIGHGRKNGFQGSLLLTSFSASATTVASDQVDLFKLIDIKKATASNSHKTHPPVHSLDPRDQNGWSPGDKVKTPQHITYQFRSEINASETPFVTVMLVWGGGHGLVGGKYKIYAMTGKDDGSTIPKKIQDILMLEKETRTDDQSQQLADYYASIAPELANSRYQISNLQERIRRLSEPQEVMVMNVSAKPRKTFILNRGQYDQPGEEVFAGTPASLPKPLKEMEANRLGLAKWLVQPNHPLTSRVAVNRVWQIFFGTGIVATSADFGSQGTPPTHPQLLDWLSVDFVQNDWDIKRLIKQIVMSSTYRQRSVISNKKLEIDPNNQLLSRGPRFRMDAEIIRDNVLKISGLLVNRIGGPSVKPYQPFGLWREVSHYGSTPATAQVFVQHHGEHLYRRSMYTFWKRTLPHPAMASFDAPNRELCTVRRSRTNTPLQALVMLNDPQFVEASRVFAERIMRFDDDSIERIHYAFEEALARLPSSQEEAVLLRTLERELNRFRKDEDAAKHRVSIGEAPRDTKLDVAEHAAWSTVAQLILNLSELVTKN